MAGFDHHAAAQAQQAPEPNAARSARYGRWLFVCYAVLYAGFVLLNAFWPASMQAMPLEGINLAVLYGLVLIVAAFVLAVFYDWLCRLLARRPNQDGEVGR